MCPLSVCCWLKDLLYRHRLIVERAEAARAFDSLTSASAASSSHQSICCVPDPLNCTHAQMHKLHPDGKLPTNLLLLMGGECG